MMPVSLEQAVPRSRVKHSTTEPLRSLQSMKTRVLADSQPPPVLDKENYIYLFSFNGGSANSVESQSAHL